jgi:hypothetical protein
MHVASGNVSSWFQHEGESCCQAEDVTSLSVAPVHMELNSEWELVGATTIAACAASQALLPSIAWLFFGSS